MKPFRFLWLVDPVKTLDTARDTTLRLAQAAAELGYESYLAEAASLTLKNTTALRVFVKTVFFGKLSPGWNPITHFSQIHYRVDPPINSSYLHGLQLLHLQVGDRLVNPISALLLQSEKFPPPELSSLQPASIVSANRDELRAFLKRHKKVVLKPLETAQSKGVEILHHLQGDRQLNRATNDFRHPVLLQKFLPNIHQGEIRLWFCDGKLLGTLKKFPSPGDFRFNLEGGSELRPCSLTPTQKRCVQRISKSLKNRQIRLAAVDLIGSKISDYNITSPGLLVELEKITKKDLAPRVITSLLRPPG